MYFKKFIQKYAKISSRFSIEQQSSLELPYFIIIGFSILSGLINVSYAIIPIYCQSENNTFFQIIAYLTRPHLLYKHNKLTSSIILSLSSFLIILVYIVMVINYNSKKAIKNIIIIQYLKIITYLTQIYDIWLIYIILETLLLGDIMILEIFSTSIYIIFFLFRIVVTKQQLFFKHNTLNSSNNSIIYYLIQIISILQMGIFIFTNDFNSAQQWQSILAILCGLMTLLNLILFKPYLDKLLDQILLSLATFSLIYSFLRLVQFNSNQDIFIIEVIMLIIWPMLWQMISKMQFNHMLLTIKTPANIYQLIFLIIYLKDSNSYSKNRILLENLINTLETKVHSSPARFGGYSNSDLIFFYQQLCKKHNNVLEICTQKLIKVALLLFLDDNLQAFMIASKLKLVNTDILTKTKFEIYSVKCRQNLMNSIQMKNNSDSDNQFQTTVNDFMRSERKNELIGREVMELLQKKLNFYQVFDFEKNMNIQEQAFQLVVQIEFLINKIKLQYSEYPSSKLQCLLSFLNAEIINDYLSANKYSKSTSLEEDKLFQMNDLKIEFSSNNWAYLIVNLEQLSIFRNSSNALQFFGQDQLILSKMIPSGVREHHDEMIFNFMRDGTCKYLRNLEESLLYSRNYLRGVNIFIELINENDSLNALLFVQAIEDPPSYMIVNNQNQLVGISEEFEKNLGIKIPHIDLLFGLPIEYIIPKFSILCMEPTVQQISLRFLNRVRLSEYLEIIQHFQNRLTPHDIIAGCWLDQNNLEYYSSHCQITNRNQQYYIIKFMYIRQNSKRGSQSMSKTFTTHTNHDESQYNEDIDIIMPYEEQSEPKYINDIVITNNFRQELILSNRESQNNTLLLNETEQRNQLLNQQSLTKNIDLSALQQQQQQQLFYQNENIEISVSNEKQLGSNNEANFDGNQSQLSSISGTKKAHYFKKYIVMERMINSNDQTIVHKRLLFFLMLFSLFTFIRTIIAFVTVDSTFNQYLTDIDLLQIKNYLFQPVESFILTRYTIINYNAQYTANQLTKTELNSLLVFPNSNLNLGFDDVQTNMGQILNRLTLQTFLAKYYDIYIYITTDTGSYYNITMRQTLSILINYQYTFKAAYIYDGKSVSDSPYIFFSYRNLLTIYNAFDKLNDDLYDQTINRADSDIYTEFSVYLPFLMISIIILSGAFIVYLKLQSNISALLGLLAYNEQSQIDKDKERYRMLIEQIQKQPDIIFKYQFNLEQKEILMKDQQKQIKVETSNKKIYKNINQKRKLSFLKGLILLIIHYLAFVGYCTFKYQYNYEYYTHFKPTAYFYKMMADLGTNIPTIYSMREVLYYRWRYPFFTTDDHEQIFDQVKTCLLQIQSSTQYLSTIQLSNYLLSTDFSGYLRTLQEDNLCNQQSEDMYTKSLNICNITLGGSLQKGLTGALVYIYTGVTNEMQINEFWYKTEPTYQELEGGFLISMLLKEVNKFMKKSFTEVTTQIINNVNMSSIIMICYIVISSIFQLYLIYPLLIQYYHLAKRFMYLIPQQTLFYDDTFERLARSIMQDQQIMA